MADSRNKKNLSCGKVLGISIAVRTVSVYLGTSSAKFTAIAKYQNYQVSKLTSTLRPLSYIAPFGV